MGGLFWAKSEPQPGDRFFGGRTCVAGAGLGFAITCKKLAVS